MSTHASIHYPSDIPDRCEVTTSTSIWSRHAHARSLIRCARPRSRGGRCVILEWSRLSTVALFTAPVHMSRAPYPDYRPLHPHTRLMATGRGVGAWPLSRCPFANWPGLKPALPTNAAVTTDTPNESQR